MASIRFEGVGKKYGKTTVINDANFEVQDKEFMVLVGPSGCGKSTLLRMIAGLEEVTTGQLFIDDQLVNDLPPKNRDIAIVFQNYALYPHMTAYNNLAFGLKIRGLKKKVIHDKVLEAARILDIEALLDRKPKAMSGGQRQRVAIGRAIVRNPKVFLFDEPLSNLDAKLRGQMRLEIARLHQKLQTTIIYVTHDQVEAMTLGDRIVVLDQGVIQQIDTPENLYAHPANKFVAGFIGTPPMNFLEGHLVKRGDRTIFENSPRTIELSIENYALHGIQKGDELTLGFRPEHVHATPVKGIEHYMLIPSEIQLIERLGHESFAFAKTGGQDFTARLLSEVNATGEMDLYLDREKIHFFSTKTGEAISASRSG